MEKVTLSSPWVLFYREITALFSKDDEVKVFFDEDEAAIKLYVEDSAKATALEKILPREKNFGNVDIKVEVVPANGKLRSALKDEQIYDIAFKGNKAYKYSETYDVFLNPITYVVFAKEVVQFFSDNLGDLHGLTSTLYQDIAQDVLVGDGVCYCTDIESNTYGNITVSQSSGKITFA